MVGGLSFFTGQSKRTLTILQKAFADKLVGKFGVRRRSTCVFEAKLEEVGESELKRSRPHRELVGDLMSFSNQTRPDITIAIRVEGR